MNKKTEQEETLKKALTLDGQQRAQFITQINDSELRLHIEAIINDQQNITQFFDEDTSHDKFDSNSGENHKSKELSSGSKINRITIEKLLGKGGMGSVYQGYDEKLKRKVAIKSIRSEYLKVESTHERFIREAQILSKINHPSICHIYDYIETDSRDYLVLELIQGKQLNQVFLDYEVLLEVLLELAKALEAAHKHGIVHRDLKPDNIMITEENKVKVLDFGIAQSLSNPLALKSKVEDNSPSEFTQQGSLVGTIRYMSPEQARGESITTASDIYSLGIIIQELFSHESAYENMETEVLLENVQKGQTAEFTTTFKPIRSLIQTLCQLDPFKRPSATEVCDEIEKLIMAPKIRKKRSILTIGLLLFITLLIVITWQWQQSSFQKNSAELAKTYINHINELVRESEQIYVLPLHNTKPGIDNVLKRGAELYTQIDNDLLLTEKDKMQLHGLIFLESEEFENAVYLLEKSKASDTLLARAWIGLYIDKTSEYSDKYGITKALEDTDLRKNYLTPAIKYINSSSQQDPVHQAFKVSLTESLEAGLVLLDKIIQTQSWDKKAIKLKTQLLLTQAQKSLQNNDWNTAKQLYEQAIQTFEQAIDMARSYPDSYLGLCQVNNQMLLDGINRTGKNIETYAQDAIAACENYLIAYPKDSFALNLLSRIYLNLAQDQMMHNRSPLKSIEAAQQWNIQSRNIDNNYFTLWVSALIHTLKAKYALGTGQLDESDITQAIELNKKAILLNAPKTQAFLTSTLIYAYSLQADFLARSHKDFSSVVEEAELVFEQSLKNPSLLNDEKQSLYLSIGYVYFIQLSYDYLADKDISSQGQKLIEVFNLANNKLLEDTNVLLNISNVHLFMAQAQLKDPETAQQHLNSARVSFEKSKAINSNSPDVVTTQLWLESLTSYLNNSHASDTEALFEQADKTLPNNPQIYYLWANHYFLKMSNKHNPSDSQALKEKGLLKINHALKIDSTNKFYLNLKSKFLKK